jgi:hypothetical protein
LPSDNKSVVNAVLVLDEVQGVLQREPHSNQILGVFLLMVLLRMGGYLPNPNKDSLAALLLSDGPCQTGENANLGFFFSWDFVTLTGSRGPFVGGEKVRVIPPVNETRPFLTTAGFTLD